MPRHPLRTLDSVQFRWLLGVAAVSSLVVMAVLHWIGGPLKTLSSNSNVCSSRGRTTTSNRNRTRQWPLILAGISWRSVAVVAQSRSGTCQPAATPSAFSLSGTPAPSWRSNSAGTGGGLPVPAAMIRRACGTWGLVMMTTPMPPWKAMARMSTLPASLRATNGGTLDIARLHRPSSTLPNLEALTKRRRPRRGRPTMRVLLGPLGSLRLTTVR